MHLKANSLEISEDDPFKNDALSRKECAEVLTNLVLNSSRPTVLAINSPWGTGKTTFLTMWSASLKSKGVSVVSFNAWENDYSGDALTSLIGEIDRFTQGIPASEGRDPAKEYILKARKYVGGILLASIPTAARFLTSGLVNLDGEALKSLADGAQKIADTKIEEYLEGKDAVLGLKRSLAGLVKNLPDIPGASGGVKLLIVIDELDRCRPTFAIDVLEKVKHFFGIPGITFAVSVDREQLSHSIKTVYGEGMDTDGYLRRFFDFEFRFPPAGLEAFHNALAGRFGIHENIKQRADRATEYCFQGFVGVYRPFAKAANLSLREQEQSFALFSLTLLTTPRGHDVFPSILAQLILLKTLNPALYYGYNDGGIGPDKVMEWFDKKPEMLREVPKQVLRSFEAILIIGTPLQNWAEQYLEKTASPDNEPGTPRTPETVRITEVQDAIRGIQGHFEGAREYLFKKLEFAASILPPAISSTERRSGA